MSQLPTFVLKAHPPRTKKNGSRVYGSGKSKRVLPSLAHEKWHDATAPEALIVKAKMAALGVSWPITQPVNVRAIFFQDVDRADACGLYQALGDLLQDVGMLQNDRLIESWDGSRRRVDRKQPRIEVEITILEDE